MQEALRRQMLKAIGQHVLLPRFIFPNAKASTVLNRTDVETAAEVQQWPQSKSVSQPQSSIQSLGTEPTTPPSDGLASRTSITDMFNESVANTVIPEENSTASKTEPYRHRLVIFSGVLFLNIILILSGFPLMVKSI